MLYNRPPVSVYRPSIYQIFAEKVNLELEKESAKKMQTCCFFLVKMKHAEAFGTKNVFSTFLPVNLLLEN